MISNSYSIVNVQGNNAVGGFVGLIDENTIIKGCYSNGQVAGNSAVGGFIGKIDSVNTVTIANSYWNIETSGQTTSAAGEGRTTAEMTAPVYGSNTYVGWDFLNVWRDDTANQNNGYPTFLWVSGIEEDENYILPETSRLYQNYPNPFNSDTSIKYFLNKGANIKLSIFDISGREISVLVNNKQPKGLHEAIFKGDDLTSGIYFFVLIVDGKIVESKKMTILK